MAHSILVDFPVYSMKNTVFLFAFILFGLPAYATAQTVSSTPKLEGKYTDWAVYSRGAGKDKTCYAISEAKIKSPTSVDHGDIYFMVSNWRSGAAKEQPSFLAGYTLKSSRPPEARIDGKKYVMYTADNEAFIENNKYERQLVAKMRSGSTMTLTGVSERGTNVNYQFSLKGITAALKKASAACK